MNFKIGNQSRLFAAVSLLGALLTMWTLSTAAAKKATPGSKRSKSSAGSATVVPAPMTPKQQYQKFHDVATRMQKLAAKELVPKIQPGTDGDGHPLTQFIVSVLDDGVEPTDSLDFAVLSDSLLPLTWRMSPAFPDTTTQWMNDAFALARGCYRLGLVGDAVEWLQTVDENARLVRARAGLEDPDSAFTAGVLHDIGKFVMNLTYRRDYGEALELSKQDGVYLRDAEQTTFGADHQHFGAFLARVLGFPEPLLDVIEKHHHKTTADGPLDLVKAVSVANTVARILSIGSSGDAVKVEPAPDTLAAIGLTGDDADEFYSEVRDQINDARDMLNLLG
jgi:putative nucleotidyltransferase with HDIG domain